MPPSYMTTKKQPSVMRIIGPVAIVFIIIYMLLNSLITISKEVVVENLKELEKIVQKAATDNGKEGKLEYGEVTIEGFGFDKHAVIRNLGIVLVERGVTYNTRRSISTASVQVSPDAFIDGKLLFSFPEPINIIENSELQSVISFPQPLKFGYFDGMQKNARTFEHTLLLPEKIIITPSHSVDDASPTKEQIELTYDRSPTLRFTSMPESKERSYVVDIKNFTLSGPEGPRLSIGNIQSNYSEKQVDENKLSGKYDMKLSDLLLLAVKDVAKPYSLEAQMTIDSLIKPEAAKGKTFADIDLSKLSLISSDFVVDLSGKISAAQDDPLLFGTANLSLQHAGAFVRSDLIPQAARGAVFMTLQKLIGKPVEDDAQINLPLRREKNGVFYINNVTFEEVTASIFSSLMQEDSGKAPVAARDNSPVPRTLPAAPPEAASGAAPFSPVISTSVDEPKPVSEGEKLRTNAKPEKTLGE